MGAHPPRGPLLRRRRHRRGRRLARDVSRARRRRRDGHERRAPVRPRAAAEALGECSGRIDAGHAGRVWRLP